MLKKIIWILSSILLIILLWKSEELIRFHREISQKVSELNRDSDSLKTVYPFTNINGEQYPEMLELIKDKAYLEARLSIGKSDSVLLEINLPDSLVRLSINGVAIHAVNIDKFDVNQLFNSLSPTTYYENMRRPIAIKEQISNIVKEPIINKKAPKDTIEAALNETLPDTSLLHPIDVKLITVNDWVVSVSASDFIIDNRDITEYSFFELLTGKYLKAVEQPEIKIMIPNADILVIYRAIPQSAHVVLRM